MAMLRRILALARKEFLSLLKDKKSRVVIIVPPLIQLVVFGYAATFDLTRVPYAVYDEDGGQASRELLARFQGSPNFQEEARVRSLDQVRELIEAKEVLLAVHIGRQFTRELAQPGQAPLQVVLDGRNSNTALIALGYVRQIVGRFNAELALRQGMGQPEVQLVTRAWFNPNLESRWFIVPGIVGLLTLVVTLLVTALSVAREREQGTFDQLLVTPMRPVEILLGKSIPGMVIGVAEGSVIILVAATWFKVPLVGHLATLYLGLFLYLLSAIGVGLMISSLSVTQQQGLMGAFLFLVPAVILSGFTTPIANMPQAVQYLTLLNPMRYFMVVVRGVFLQGASLELLLPQMWPMAVIGVVCLAVAGWLFRHRMY